MWWAEEAWLCFYSVLVARVASGIWMKVVVSTDVVLVAADVVLVAADVERAATYTQAVQ